MPNTLNNNWNEFRDSCDHYNSGDIGRKYQIVSGAPTLTAGRTYGNALRFATGGDSVEAGMYLTTFNGTPRWALFAASMRLDSGGFTPDPYQIVVDFLYDDGPYGGTPPAPGGPSTRYVSASVAVYSDGRVAVVQGGTQLCVSAAGAVPFDAWCAFEARLLAATGASGACGVRVNGAEVCAATNVTTSPGPFDAVTNVRFGSTRSPSGVAVSFDDVKMRQQADVATIAYVGDRAVRCYLPTAERCASEITALPAVHWTASGGGSKAGILAGTKSNWDSSYLTHTDPIANILLDLYEFGDMPLTDYEPVDPVWSTGFGNAVFWPLVRKEAGAAAISFGQGTGRDSCDLFVLGAGIEYVLTTDFRFYAQVQDEFIGALTLDPVAFGLLAFPPSPPAAQPVRRWSQFVCERIDPPVKARTWAAWLGT